ncbi:MAG: ATP-binding protein [Acidobacteria bacterium]|nr:ATP-binding protein [Acidobacteriota bacterium]
MANPFIYGEIVPDEAFADRNAELDRLVADLSSGQKVFLISPRRYGKSSLVHRALHALSRHGALTVELTVSSYSSYVAFLEGYARALATVETKWQRARAWLTEVITTTRPELRYEPEETGPGRFSVAFPLVRTAREVNRLANEVFSLPGRLAADRKRTVIVALDEFQAIDAFNGAEVEHALRAAAQQTAPPGLQSGPRHAAGEDSAGRVRRVHRTPVRRARHPRRTRPRGCHRRPGGESPVRRAAARPRDLGRRARRGRAAGRSGAAARDAHAPARRAGHDVRGRLAAPDAGAARRPPRGRPAGRPRTALGRHPHAASARRPVEHPGVARGARQARSAPQGRTAVRRHRFALPRVDRAEDILGLRLWALGFGLWVQVFIFCLHPLDRLQQFLQLLQ